MEVGVSDKRGTSVPPCLLRVRKQQTIEIPHLGGFRGSGLGLLGLGTGLEFSVLGGRGWTLVVSSSSSSSSSALLSLQVLEGPCALI